MTSNHPYGNHENLVKLDTHGDVGCKPGQYDSLISYSESPNFWQLTLSQGAHFLRFLAKRHHGHS